MAYHKILRRISCCFKAISLCILLVSKLRLNVFKKSYGVGEKRYDNIIANKNPVDIKMMLLLGIIKLFLFHTLTFFLQTVERKKRKEVSWLMNQNIMCRILAQNLQIYAAWMKNVCYHTNIWPQNVA